MIEARGLTKRYGDKVAVQDLTFSVPPGVVTGFLGPNGAGKSTTMRLVLGLDAPTSGSVLVDGKPYAQHDRPLHAIGALLEARAVHTSRSAYMHLRALAASHGISRRRVDEVIDLVGLHDVARKRVGAFSLGMGQRLGLASALLGDPGTLLLDEPVNGLDPEGIRWVRELLRGLADEGRAVLVSSHLMSEMALTADRLLVIGRGRLVADTSMQEFLRSSSSELVVVRCTETERLAQALRASGAQVTAQPDGALQVAGLPAERIGDLALELRVALRELAPQQVSLEEAFMELTRDAVEYRADVHADVHAGSAA